MKHLDAKAIRERLHAVTLAIDTLENCSDHPAHLRIAQAADRALWLATFRWVAPDGRLWAGFDWRQRVPALLVALPSCLDQEIALLVTDDEIEEHGQNPTDGMQAKRRDIRTKTAA